MCWVEIQGEQKRNVWPLPEDLAFLKSFKYNEIDMGNTDAKNVYAALKNYPNISKCMKTIWSVYNDVRIRKNLPSFECEMVVKEIIVKKKMKLFVGYLYVMPTNPLKEPICYTLFRTSFCSSKKAAQHLTFYLFLTSLAPDYNKCKQCFLPEDAVFSIVDTRDSVFDVNGHTVIEQAMELLSAAWDRSQESKGSAAAVSVVQRYEDPSVSTICCPDQNKALTSSFKKLMQCKQSYAGDGAKVKFGWSLESRAVSNTTNFLEARNENSRVTRHFFRVEIWRIENSTMLFPSHGGEASEPEPEASFSSSTAEDCVVEVLYQCLLQTAKKWSCATQMADLFKEFALTFVFPFLNVPYRVAEIYCDGFFGCRGEESPILLVEVSGSNLNWEGAVKLNLSAMGGMWLKNGEKEKKVVYSLLTEQSSKKQLERDGMVWFGKTNFCFVSHVISGFAKDKYPLSEVTKNVEQLFLEKCVWTEKYSEPTALPSSQSWMPSPSPSGTNDAFAVKEPTGSSHPMSGAMKRMRDENRSAGITTQMSQPLTVQMTPDELVIHPSFRAQLSPNSRGLLLLMDHLWKPFYWMLFRMEEGVYRAETSMESASHGYTTPRHTNSSEEHGEGVATARLHITLEVHRCASRSCITAVENDGMVGVAAPTNSAAGSSFPFPRNTYVAFTCHEQGTNMGIVLKKVLQKALTVLVSYRQMVTESYLFSIPPKYDMP